MFSLRYFRYKCDIASSLVFSVVSRLAVRGYGGGIWHIFDIDIVYGRDFQCLCQINQSPLDEYGYVLSLQHEKCCEKKSEILHLANTALQNTTCSSL